MGILRVTCPIAVFAASILLAAPSIHADSGNLVAHNFDRLAARQADGRKWKVVDTLQVNVSKAYRLVVPGKCEDAGKAELRQLAAYAVLEESYAFIPSSCLWIEVGYDETRRTVRADTKFIDNLLLDFPSLAIYHTHVGVPRTVAGYFPGYSDLVALLLVNARFLRVPNIQIDHRAVTVLGVIEYRFVASRESERLLDVIKRTGLGSHVAQNLAYEYSRARHKRKYYAAVRECDRLTNGDPARLPDCFPMNADAFEFRYKLTTDLAAAR